MDLIAALKAGGLPTVNKPVAVDTIHRQVLEAFDWPLTRPVTTAFGGPCDLVLVAVPEGTGNQIAGFLADHLLLLEETPDA